MGTSTGIGRPRGRGPSYTWRQMPVVLPRRRKDLRCDGVSDWKLRHHHVQVAYGVMIPVPDSGHDPDARGGYPADIVTRARAHHLIRSDAVIGGWSAAAIHGLRPDWADSAPVCLLSGKKHRRSTVTRKAVANPLQAVVQPLPDNLETERPDSHCPSMNVVTPPVAAAHCLWTILTGRHEWWVHDVPGLSWREVRAVQFVDAFAQCTWVTRTQILEADQGLIPRSVLAPLLDLSDDGAQSPMETVMRLIVRDLLPAPYSWTSQFRVDLEPDSSDQWSPRTLPDLACPELKIALYYDGAHHLDASQTDVDFDQFHALRDLRWEALRFNRHHFRSPGKLRERVGKAAARAIAGLETPVS